MNNEAERAISLYKSAKQKGDMETAQLYLINSVSHDSSMENLRFYVNELMNMEASELEDMLSQTFDILSQAAINGSPDNIEEIRLMIAQLQRRRDEPGKQASIDTTIDEEQQLLDELEKTSWSNLLADGIFDSENIRWDIERLGKRQELLRGALSSGYLSDAQASEIADELGRTELQMNFCSGYNDFYRLGQDIIAGIAISDGKLDAEQKTRFVSMAQQMSNILNQMIAMPDEGLADAGSESSIYNKTSKMISTFKNVDDKLQVAIGQDVLDELTTKIDGFLALNAEKNSLVSSCVDKLSKNVLSLAGSRERIIDQLSKLVAKYEYEKGFLSTVNAEITRILQKAFEESDPNSPRTNSEKIPLLANAFVEGLFEKPRNSFLNQNSLLNIVLVKAKTDPVKMTARVKSAQELKEYISSRINLIPASQHQEIIAGKIKKIDGLVVEWQKQRYASYQRHVAALCREAVKNWDNTTIVSESDAQKWLEELHFAEVDESTLSPEAAGVFQSIKSRLMSKLSKEAKADFDYQCIVSSKKTLEDF